MDKAYVPIPFLEDTFEPIEWSHILAIIDVSALHHPTKFCDPDNYDIIPICMIELIELKENTPEVFHQDVGILIRKE